MLVLSRHKDESIVMTGGIVITVTDIRGDKVRLGITAPDGIAIHRKEVWDAINRKDGTDEARPGKSARPESDGDDEA